MKSAVPRAESAPADPELSAIVSAWPTLPEHIRQAVLALVRTARAMGGAE